MINTVDIEGYRGEASALAKKWKNIGYRIKGRVAMITAAKHGKRQLRDGTAERLRNEILKDLAWLAQSKKTNELIQEVDGENRVQKILRSIARQNKLWRNKNANVSTPYNRESIKILLSTPSTNSEVFFVREYLQRFMGVRRETIDNIVSNPSFIKN